MTDEKDDDKNKPDPANARWESRAEKESDDDWRKMDEEQLVEEIGRRIKRGKLVDEFEEELPSIMELSARMISRLSKMSLTMRAHYKGEIIAISKDLSRDVRLDLKDDKELTLLIMCLLQFPEDDDDDDGKDAPALPKIGDLANV